MVTYEREEFREGILNGTLILHLIHDYQIPTKVVLSKLNLYSRFPQDMGGGRRLTLKDEEGREIEVRIEDERKRLKYQKRTTEQIYGSKLKIKN